MPPRTHTLGDARRFAAWLGGDVGRELRIARETAGLTMQQVADRLGCSKSKVSRIERGVSPPVTIEDLVLLGALVALRPSIKLFPRGRPLRDVGQIELLAALNVRMHSIWLHAHEVPMPQLGDLRAADQLSTIPGCRVMIEAFRRLSDYQAQARLAREKQRDLGADRLILLIEDTHANRRALRAAGAEVRRSFPIPQRAMLAALAAGRDPLGDGIVLLRRLPGAGAGAATATVPARTAPVAPRATKGE